MSTTTEPVSEFDVRVEQGGIGQTAREYWTRVKGGDLRLTATEGYADVLLGEQTKKRAKALAEAMELGLRI